MNARAAGLGVALVGFVGLALLSGQFVPPTGSGLRFDCSPGERLEWDGDSWECRRANDYRSKHLDWSDEWMLLSCGSNQSQCGSIYSVSISGTSATAASSGTTSRPGLLDLRTGTTSTGLAAVQTRADVLDFASYTSLVFEWTGGFTTLSTSSEEYAAYAGFGDTGTAINQTDGCGFLYDRGNVATGGQNSGNADKWQCYCASNSTRTSSVFLMDGTTVSNESFTTVNQPVAAASFPNTNVHDFKIVITTTAGVPTRAEFYVDNIKSCNITNNLPSGGSRLTGAMVGIFKSAGNTSRTFTVDRTRLAVDLISARSL